MANEQDIAELAKRVLELAEEVHKPKSSTYESRRASANFSNFMWEAAPKLAQAVLELQTSVSKWQWLEQVALSNLNKACELNDRWLTQIDELKAEIAALRPDALAWREREARIEGERAELRERMGK